MAICRADHCKNFVEKNRVLWYYKGHCVQDRHLRTQMGNVSLMKGACWIMGMNRRDFLKAAGVAGLGVVLLSGGGGAHECADVPDNAYTGVHSSI
jgi:hypothetical protein